MSVVDHNQPVRGEHPPERATAALAGWAALLLASIALVAYLWLTSLPAAPGPPPPPAAATDIRTARLGQFFDEQVEPAVLRADVANRLASERCVLRLEETFDKYRRGVRPFAEDLTSWGTRWGVVRRMPANWWYERTDIQRFVTGKFAAHLFTEDSLTGAINSALVAFREDVEANNNALLVNVQAAVSNADLASVPELSFDRFAADVTRAVEDYSARAAASSVKNLVLTELAAGAGGAAATQIVAAIGARVAAMAATTSAGAGGATAGGAAVGGGGGSTVGPVGTAVGFGVGLVAGLIVDRWMSASFQEDLSLQLHGMIDEIAKSVLDGTRNQTGVKQSLAETCDVLRDAYRQSLYDRIVKESTP